MPGAGAVHHINSGCEQSQQRTPYSITSSASASRHASLVNGKRRLAYSIHITTNFLRDSAVMAKDALGGGASW
jgi:hypothetical protein